MDPPRATAGDFNLWPRLAGGDHAAPIGRELDGQPVSGGKFCSFDTALPNGRPSCRVQLNGLAPGATRQRDAKHRHAYHDTHSTLPARENHRTRAG